MNLLRRIFNPHPKKKPVKINLTYPTSWENLSFQEFREVCRILSIPGVDRERGLFLCLCSLAHIRPDNPGNYDPVAIKGKMPFIINGQSYMINSKAVAEACHDIAFVYDEIGLPPSPLEKVDRMLYYVPFDTFYTADSYIMRYQAEKEKNNAWLKEAVKALTGGRKRKLEPWERLAVVVWWNGLKKALSEKYPYVLKGSGGSVTEKTQAEILQDILASMNDNRPQENEKILKADVHSVLHALNNIYRDADKRVSH